MAAVTLASLIEGFFMEWLGRDRKASANTTATYRDAFRLFFSWLESERGVPPVEAELGRQLRLPACRKGHTAPSPFASE